MWRDWEDWSARAKALRQEPCVFREGQRAGGRGSMRRSEEEMREVNGRSIDLALTLSEKGPGGFCAQES